MIFADAVLLMVTFGPNGNGDNGGNGVMVRVVQVELTEGVSVVGTSEKEKNKKES
jgi:hypothetical protein